jgi:hypothetical protein
MKFVWSKFSYSLLHQVVRFVGASCLSTAEHSGRYFMHLSKSVSPNGGRKLNCIARDVTFDEQNQF